MSNVDDDLVFFELEFCLKKEVFKKAYNEDGVLWNNLHDKQMECFHRLFLVSEGRQKIIGDIKAIYGIFIKRKDTFFNEFNKEEFSEEEKNFLKNWIFQAK